MAGCKNEVKLLTTVLIYVPMLLKPVSAPWAIGCQLMLLIVLPKVSPMVVAMSPNCLPKVDSVLPAAFIVGPNILLKTVVTF